MTNDELMAEIARVTEGKSLEYLKGFSDGVYQATKLLDVALDDEIDSNYDAVAAIREFIARSEGVK